MKYSNFHITVNFNVDSEDHIGAFRAAIEEMAEAPHLWQWLKQYVNGGRADFGDEEQELVDRVRIRAAFEHEGEQNHGLHAHLLVEVAHTTMVQIDKRGLCDYFEQSMEMRPNINIRFLKGSGEDKDFILHYITKEVSVTAGGTCPHFSPLHPQVPRAPRDHRNQLLRRALVRGQVVDAENEI